MRKKLLIGLGVVFTVVALLVVGFVAFVKVQGNRRFAFPPTGLAASTDPAVIAEGEYLFHGPMHCTACHDTSKEVALERKPAEKVDPIGGMTWDMGPMGMPVSANLTSDPETGLARRSDEYVASVLKHGVTDEGKLVPFMALAVAPVTDHEVVALLSYLRSLSPKKHEVPAEQWGFMAEALIAFGKFGPKERAPAAYVAPSTEPDPRRGEYLATGPALCSTCHSPYDFFDGMALSGPLFSGCLAAEPGHHDPTIELCPPNLTPHPTVGHITTWSEDQFVARIQSGALTSKDTSMPWQNYASMTDTDLRSIYRYLRSLPPADRNSGPPIRPVGSHVMPAPAEG